MRAHPLLRRAAQAAPALLVGAVLLWPAAPSALAADPLAANGAALELTSGSQAVGAITDQLSSDRSAVEITSEPAGTAFVHVAIMANLAGEQLEYLNLPAGDTRYVPPAGLPVVDVQAFNASQAPIGGWAGRQQTVPAETPEEASITDHLSTDGSTIEVSSEPPGTAYVHVALMANLAGQGIEYIDLPASQTRYTPPAGMPVVDVQAFSPDYTPIGDWAGRLQSTAPAEEPPKEEPPKEEPPKEEPPKEEPPKEEPPKEEPPKEEPPSEEPPNEEEHRGSMWVGLDTGGWNWESAVRDFAGAVHYVRSSYGYYDNDGEMALLARYGVHLMPLFNTSPLTSSRAAFAAGVLAWFERYGHGGSFWRGRTDLGATTAEIVNEPGNPYFWGPSAQTDQAAYAGLIEAVANALKALPAANRPRLLVSFDGGFEGDAYGRALIHQDPHLLQLGIGWTVHPYGGHGSPQSSAEGNRSRVTEAHQATGQPVFVTEVGWPTAVGLPPTGDSMQWSEAQQAANIRSFVEWARGLGYVGAVVDFNYADYGSNNWYGIVDGAGTGHKLSYATLASL